MRIFIPKKSGLRLKIEISFSGYLFDKQQRVDFQNPLLLQAVPDVHKSYTPKSKTKAENQNSARDARHQC